MYLINQATRCIDAVSQGLILRAFDVDVSVAIAKLEAGAASPERHHSSIELISRDRSEPMSPD